MDFRLCFTSTLNEDKVKGKIVLCYGGVPDDVKELGGTGTILVDDVMTDTGFTYGSPVTVLDSNQANKIEKYINSTK